MMTKDLIANGDDNLLHVYNRQQVVFEKGEGAYLYDVDGKEYLDCFSGIGVMGLGYGNREYTEAIKSQMDKLTHISNLYYTKPLLDAGEKVTKAADMEKIFFTNSGTEAIEGAIKAARKYAYLKDGCTDHEIIAMNHSFHGRSYGALSVTGNEKYRAPFAPMIGYINFADFNDLDSVKALVNDKTCAIILETIQGEGGVTPATKEFLQGVKDICTANDILLILDEVQCGMGRSGAMFAWQNYGVKPDIMVLAKSLGCGVPVGAFLLTKEVAEKSLVPGDHGTTYGGNPLVCAAVNAVFDIYEKEKILDHVKELTPYFEKKLDEVVANCKNAVSHRGMGFMQGIVVTCKPGDVVNKALEKGLVTVSAGTDVVRLLPPLIYTKAEIDKACAILTEAINEIA